MASKTSYIPRYLLPQYGALWRTAVRSNALTRPINAELGQVLVRYASKTAVPKGAPPKAVSSKSTAAKAAKHSAPTKPPPKTPPPKPAAAAQPATPKTPTSRPVPTPEPTPVAAAAPKSVSKPTPAPGTPAPTPTTKTTTSPKPRDPSKPLVLEKPERFNPPSHGARLPRSTPKHYGGELSEAEFQAQTVKSYPGLPPPPNTWSHWFLNNRSIHLFITLGTLTSLAIYTFIANFNAKSPFADLIPPISELPRHPFQYIGVLIDVMRMHEEHESAVIAEKRRMRVDDVAKRAEYRKAHGLEATQGFFGNSGGKPAPEPEPVPVIEPEAAPTAEPTPDGKRKKWLGIF